MVCVAAVALGSSTYAWFVSNNNVKATTTNISAQSNSAYLVIDTKKTSTSSTSSATAAEEVGTGKTYEDAALYPAQWAKNFNVSKENADTKIYQFESAYAEEKDNAAEKSGTRFAVGDPTAAVTADYALLNQFYIGTGTYDGQFKNLKVDSMTVSAIRVLVYIDQNNWALVSPTGVEASCLAGTVVTDDTTKKLGIIRTDAFGKAEGDVNVKLYAFYDGANEEVKTTQLTALQENVGATVSFSATPTEFK